MSLTDVEKWIRRANKKNAKLMSENNGVYDIVYFDKGKARVGRVKDGMHCRYGISCRGAMWSDDILSLWQSGPASCSAEDVKAMQDYFNGSCNLPDFDFSIIKGLRH